MDFARKQLEKYGWKDGVGLGKECQGMSIALKPRLKSGKEGMGYDLCKDLTDTWWTKAYSDCLNRIDVSTSPSAEDVGVTIREDNQVGDVEEGEITKKIKHGKKKVTKSENNLYCSGIEERPIEKMRKRMMKANFTSFSKGGTLLTNGEVVKAEGEEIGDPESKETLAVKVLSDEELLKACGGRTAHKAARFGLKLNGKLARLAAQDETSYSLYSDILNKSSDNSESAKEVKAKKKKERKSKSKEFELSQEIKNIEETSQECAPQEIPPKKKRKRDKEATDLVEANIQIDECIDVSNSKKKDKTKDRVQYDKLTSEENYSDPSIEINKELVKKKKKSKRHLIQIESEVCES